jgi:hypothetical protein
VGDWIKDTGGRIWLILEKSESALKVRSQEGARTAIGALTLAEIIPAPSGTKQPDVFASPPPPTPKPERRPPAEKEKQPARETAPAGVLITLIPPGKDLMTLAEAFRALQGTRYLRREPLTPAERTAEEERFKKLLQEEIKAGTIMGGAGQAGTKEENRRLRVGQVTGFIMRP